MNRRSRRAKRSRDRRSTKDHWYQLIETVDTVTIPSEDVSRLVTMERKRDTRDLELYIRGSIDDVVVVALPPEMAGAADGVADAVRNALRDSGVDKEVLLVPQNVRFMRLREVPRDKAASLTRSKELAEIREIASRRASGNDTGGQP